MAWRGPEWEGDFPTLGWDVIAWCEEYLRVPDGPHAGERLRFSDDQSRFIARLYEIDPVTGKRLVRRAVYRRAKGSGKSPMLGGLAVCELAGPCVFDGWDANGEPVVRPRVAPVVQMGATAEDQVWNTYGPAYEMLRDSPALDEFGIDWGLTRMYLRGRPGQLSSITAEAKSKEGARPTFAVLDETHLWLKSNGGVRLAAVMRRNAGKVGGVTVETTNAHVPGEGSVAEESFKAWEAGAVGVLYDSIEAPEVEDIRDPVQLRPALAVSYSGSPWVDLDRIVEECVDPATSGGDVRRFYLNQARAPEDDVTPTARWAELAVPGLSLVPGDVIALGFDGSESGDGTALWACRWPDWSLHRIGYWEAPSDAPRGSWHVPRGEVDDVVRATFTDYRVALMLADPPYWRKELDEWSGIFGPKVVLEFPTSSDRRVAGMTNRWESMVTAGTLSHDGDPLLTQHLANARREACSEGWRPAKKGTGRIDAVVAAMNAVEALGRAVDQSLIPGDVELDVEAMVV